MKYKLTQTASKGPISRHPSGLSWGHHLIALAGWLCLSIIILATTLYGVSVLRRSNPEYFQGDDTDAKAFCEALNKRADSEIVFDGGGCVMVKDERE